jgi:hypothetical protein
MAEADIELSFVGGYDPAIIAGTAEAGNAEFESLVQSKVNDMVMVLNLQPGVNSMASYVDYNGLVYKINVREVHVE